MFTFASISCTRFINNIICCIFQPFDAPRAQISDLIYVEKTASHKKIRLCVDTLKGSSKFKGNTHFLYIWTYLKLLGQNSIFLQSKSRRPNMISQHKYFFNWTPDVKRGSERNSFLPHKLQWGSAAEALWP